MLSRIKFCYQLPAILFHFSNSSFLVISFQIRNFKNPHIQCFEWLWKYFFHKTLISTQFNSNVSRKNLLLQDFIPKSVDFGCIGQKIIYISFIPKCVDFGCIRQRITYISLTYKKANSSQKSIFMGMVIFFLSNLLLSKSRLLRKILNFCPVWNFLGTGWQAERSLFWRQKSTSKIWKTWSLTL